MNRYVDRLFEGIQDGQKVSAASRLVGLITGVAGLLRSGAVLVTAAAQGGRTMAAELAVSSSGLLTIRTVGGPAITLTKAQAEALATNGMLAVGGIMVYATGVDPDGLSSVPKNEASHDAGVQLGRKYAESKLGLKQTNFVNPFEHFGKFGRGFDDVMEDAAGNLWIVEYKGGSGALAPGQMSPKWVRGNIQLLLKKASWNPWGKRLEAALDSHKLKGIAISSTDGPAGVTVELQRWIY